MLYLSEEDLLLNKQEMLEMFGLQLPARYSGYSTNYHELVDESGTDVMVFTD